MAEEAEAVAIDELPARSRWSLVELFEIGSQLVAQNADLPSSFTMCDIYPRAGQLTFQFAAEPESVPALVAWAQRLGGVIQAGTHTPAGGEPYRWCRVQFPFRGVPVGMYTHLPAPEPLPVDPPAEPAEQRR